MKITKRNKDLFKSSNLLPKKNKGLTESQSREIGRNMNILDEYYAMYEALEPSRQRCRRNVNYVFGRQLDDFIQDPDGCGNIREKDYIIRQGNIPLVTNVIGKVINSVTGVYTQNEQEPYVLSRDRDEQKLGEMMTTMMQYVYQTLNIHLRNATAYKNALIKGIVAFRFGCDYSDERHIEELYTEELDFYRLAFDKNTSGLYMENLTKICYLHDCTKSEIKKIVGDYRLNKDIDFMYAENEKHHSRVSSSQYFDGDENSQIDFWTCKDKNDYRVYECWERIDDDCVRVWDTQQGREFWYKHSDIEWLEIENERRRKEMEDMGGDPDDAALLDIDPNAQHQYWHVRWMTPSGYILREEDSPFTSECCPFVIGAYPLIDGEIHSIVDDAIPTQRLINRLMMRMEFIRMSSAKGVLIVPEQLLEGKDLNKIASQWAKANGIIALKWKEGIPMPQQIASSASTAGDMEQLQMQMRILDDITGVSGALRGEKPSSGTPSSLYAQQAQNSSTNIDAFQKWFIGLIKKRDTKLMQTAQQFWKHSRYMEVAGKDYSEESKWWDWKKICNTDFDLAMVESTSSIASRAMNESILMNLLQMGQIDAELYLEQSSNPGSDKLLERLKQRKQELQQQQAALQAQGQQPNQMIEQAMQ